MLNRRRVILGSLAAVSGIARAQTAPPSLERPAPPGLSDPIEMIDLWPDGAPGMPASPPEETVVSRSENAQLSDRAVHGIRVPRMAVFRATTPNGAAVLVTPGGAYRRIVVDHEGYETGRWLAARGVTAFVLFYRLPGEGWVAGPDVSLADAQRAIRIIRHRAGDFGLDPLRVAALGFSAGGHLCADLATRFNADCYSRVDAADAFTARPFAAAPIYPVISMTTPLAHSVSRQQLIGTGAARDMEAVHSPHLNVTDDTPPVFLAHAEDDGSVPVENTLEMRAALKSRQIPVETHLFAHGGHGFGISRAADKPAGAWPELFLTWSRSIGLV